MKTTLITIIITASLIFPATAGSPSGTRSPSPSSRRRSINSYRDPIATRITAAQFRTTCIPHLTNTYGIARGNLTQLKKHILTPTGPRTTHADHVPALIEYKVIQTLDDALILSTPASNPTPSIITKIPGRKQGDILLARLFPTGRHLTINTTTADHPTPVTCEMHINWITATPTPTQLLTAFNNGTAFYIVLPTGPDKLPTLYLISIN